MRTEFAKIYGRIDKMEGQIQALNARIDAIEKQIENMREENNNKMNLLCLEHFYIVGLSSSGSMNKNRSQKSFKIFKL